ncbi:ABC transporter ATP-binding protein [Verminephrobacter eiseniae]|uniref:ABC transporter ATP-binding protein n=1 Tax=Verminephrobacter eiseniae TaxID=364317 RepID=UPI0022380410|nr:ABC transporter ATP-binding protein [Verminephrobacter eiseniae]MCW5263140.1 ABC transporter ATP-binding protein [Verminephrobacter eiseniae]
MAVENERHGLAQARPIPVVRLAGIEKSYRAGRINFIALEDIDLEITRGEFVALCGQSGSGKSTLLNLVGGIDHPTSGSVHFLGQELASMGDTDLSRLRAREIGFIFQFFNLLPVMSVFDNVAYPLMLLGKAKSQARHDVFAMLERVGLRDHWQKRPAELSGGQQQRVAIARALVKKPTLIVADEPTGNLDSETGLSILDLMKEINAESSTTLLVSTHSEFVKDRASRVVELKDGRVIHDSK